MVLDIGTQHTIENGHFNCGDTKNVYAGESRCEICGAKLNIVLTGKYQQWYNEHAAETSDPQIDYTNGEIVWRAAQVSVLRELYDTQRQLPERNFAKDHTFEEWLANRGTGT